MVKRKSNKNPILSRRKAAIPLHRVETTPRLLGEIIPERLNRPDHFRLIARRHHNAFAWRRQSWIPLGVVVNDPRHGQGITYDHWLDAEVFLSLQAKMLRDTLEVGSDIMPTMAINHMGTAIPASMFGLGMTIPTDHITSVQNVGPWMTPALKDIREVDDMPVPDVHSEVVRQAERFMRFYRRNLPPWVKVVPPAKIGPFSMAELVRGSGFYLDLVLDPQRCRRLVEICADAIIRLEKYFRRVAGPDGLGYYSQFGIAGPGPRLGEDSIINVSPEMITEFAVPGIEQIANAFGSRVYLHFCTLERSNADHVYAALAESPHVFAASSQFGFEYYRRNVDTLQGRLAIESFYGDALNYVVRKYGSFESWAREFVPRFKDRSGLVLYFEVESVDQGKCLWDIWERVHSGKGTS